MASKLKKLLDVAVDHTFKISCLGYVAGILWFVALVHPPMNNQTYFSENALLPGMVETTYRYGRSERDLKTEIEQKMKSGHFLQWLMGKMNSIGLEVYHQNFTVNLPQELLSMNEEINGTNIYGILRAPRTSRSEAIVFMIPWKQGTTDSYDELVFMLSLAEHFRNNIYWSKDIIFLIVDQGEIGVQSWLDEYHGVVSKYVKSSRMFGRSGAMQAAINIEFQNEEFNVMQIIVESLNGQLPNLDLVNMVIRLCQGEGIPVELKKFPVSHFYDGWDEFRSSLSTMVSMMYGQASCRPSANHGVFPKYGIEAVTLRGLKKDRGNYVRFGNLGRSVEGMFRSLNSLLEKFHQSFFFYLLSSTSRYVSIGLYMPPLACVMVGPIVTALSLWMTSLKEKVSTNEDKITKKDEAKETKHDEREKFPFTRPPQHFLKAFRVILAGYFVGSMAYLSPWILQYVDATSFGVHPSHLFVAVLLGVIVLGSGFVLTFRYTSNFEENDVALLKSFALVIFVCQVGCLATVNFSFAFFLATFSLPTFLIVRSTKNRYRRFLQVLCAIVTSPPSVLFILTIAYCYFTTAIYEDQWSCVEALYTDIVLLSYRDSFVLLTWSYSVFFMIIYPNWTTFWFIAWM
ncbi:glycosylphosphatidylinositol anchor attachment 1 protein-like [Xenia sp. Carnegie-2017]|uniref:glycosylphosphatidylinositol anchor attachment 1 protein-like n=1 Tax=Xenia sp. Carnegie-2017 TaxID=2897299 RepID=UPI001F03B522|nr:glycosylphosphatidylinositol anchor attachment 1 protein-like [Xenia sp. Carnegie-2017]